MDDDTLPCDAAEAKSEPDVVDLTSDPPVADLLCQFHAKPTTLSLKLAFMIPALLFAMVYLVRHILSSVSYVRKWITVLPLL